VEARAHRIRLSAEAVKVSFPRPDCFQVDLADGRTITVPLAWFPRLLRATPDQLTRVEIAAHGAVLRWPDVDEDILVEGLLATDEIVVWPDVDMRISPGTTAAAPRTRPVP
jgi:hypothetical protein